MHVCAGALYVMPTAAVWVCDGFKGHSHSLGWPGWRLQVASRRVVQLYGPASDPVYLICFGLLRIKPYLYHLCNWPKSRDNGARHGARAAAQY